VAWGVPGCGTKATLCIDPAATHTHKLIDFVLDRCYTTTVLIIKERLC
jgi:hypothetical protein